MRNWPKRLIPWRTSLHRYISTQLVNFAAHLPHVKRGPLHYLQEFTRHEEVKDYDRTAKPEDVSIDLTCISFCELVMAEDINRLCDALQALLRRYGRGVGGDDRRLEEWRESERYRYQGGAWTKIGSLRLRDIKGSRIEYCLLSLSHLAPSVYFLRAIAIPTEAARAEFKRIIAYNEKPSVLIHRILRGYSVSEVMASQIRREKVNWFFLQMNRDFVKLLRRYVTLGWSKNGPLPSVVMYELQKGDMDAQGQSAFWSSLGMRSTWRAYTGNGFTIFDDENEIPFEPNKIVVHTPTVVTEERLKTCSDKLNVILLESSDLLRDYAILRCIFYHASLLNEQLVSIRDSLVKVITGRRRLLSPLGKYANTLAKLAFEQKRIATELKNDDLKALLDAVGTVHLPPRKERKVSLLESLLFRLDLQWTSNDEQLKVLAESYRAVKDDALQRSFVSLNRLGVLLAILAVFVGCADLLPEDVKKQVYEEAINWFSTLFRSGSGVQ
jgi:hypothetical protein